MQTRSSFTHRKGLVGMALVGVAAMTVTACGLQSSAQQQPLSSPANGAPPANSAQPGATPGQAGQTPIAVNCGPGQQALIRPVIIGAQSVSQVDCVAAVPPATMAAYPQGAYAPQAVPATYVSYPEPAPRVVERTVLQPTAVQPTAVQSTAVQSTAVRRASYRTSGEYVQYEPRRRERSWQKSAVIIGSTAGIGAGVGGAAGGKKGALIGAAIGGGGAAIWDQVQRRDR